MQIAKIKNPDYLTLPILRALDRKQKHDKTHPRGANQGGDKERGLQKGENVGGTPLVVSTFWLTKAEILKKYNSGH